MTYTFAAADFGFNDASDTPADTLQGVKITKLPGAGKLTNNGVALKAGASVSVTDIAAGKLKFAPAANGRGKPYESFTFQVRDSGGTVNNRIDTDSVSATLRIVVILTCPHEWNQCLSPG